MVAEMTRRRKWAAVPALLAVGALVAGLAAYSGAQATGPGADRPHDERLDIRDTVFRGVDLNAKPGPWGYSAASSDQGNSPVQPVAFTHPLHVQKLGMNCLYCHNNANKSPDVGMPAVATCMGCHTVVATQKPEIKRLAAYWSKKQPVPWVRIHKVPEYVHFPHMRHVNAGVTCQTCHGQVQKMNQVYQYASLNMGWCVNCHVNGYDPAKGDSLAGYQRTANGYQPLKSADAGAAAIGLPLVATANAQTRGASPAVPSTPGGAATSGQVKRARYDCSVCHY
jgi:hypothetical protein